MKRNFDKHTSAEQAKLNILRHCAAFCRDGRSGAAKSTLGYAAFPDYRFKAPQGAAFSVAKIVQQLHEDGLITTAAGAFGGCRYYITAKGLQSIGAA